MNTEIDLNAFRREKTQTSHVTPVARDLVSPPRRIFTRYVIPSLLLSGFVAILAYSMRASLTRTVAVNVIMPSAGEVTEQAGGGTPLFQAPGWVEPYPLPTIISARTTGVIKKVHVLEGQEVPAGTLIADLVDTDAVIEVRRAQADLELKRAEYVAAKENWDNPISLNEAIRTAEAMKAQLLVEKQEEEQALQIADRQAYIDNALSRTGAGARIPAQKATLEAKAAKAAISLADARIQANEAALEASKERLHLRIEDKQKLATAQAELRAAEAALEKARYELSLRRVESPTSGVIMRLYATAGSMVSMEVDKGNQIAAIYDPSSLQVRAEVPLADAAKIRHGIPAEMRFDPLPDRVFHGELVRVVHEFDIQRNTLPIKVRATDPDPALKPEMIGRLQFSSPIEPGKKKETGTAVASTLIPATLAPADAKEAKLWIAHADGTAHHRTVKFGSGRKGELREVISGLTPADKIIMSPPADLTEGTRVTVAKDQGESVHAH